MVKRLRGELRAEETVGRPIGSVNKERPFKAALKVALNSDPLRLRRIADKLAERAEQGDLVAIREIADRLDGKPAQVVDRSDAPVEELSDAELYLIASGRVSRTEKPKVLLISPPPKVRP
jgi:hypothetical protein